MFVAFHRRYWGDFQSPTAVTTCDHDPGEPYGEEAAGRNPNRAGTYPVSQSFPNETESISRAGRPFSSALMEGENVWNLKFMLCVLYDFLDMTVGRVLFPIPFLGEIVGCALCAAMFGKSGLFYGLEGLDPTEQIDGFIPTATIIALRNRPEAELGPAA